MIIQLKIQTIAVKIQILFFNFFFFTPSLGKDFLIRFYDTI